MSKLNDITLADGQATPVNHTFVGYQTQNGQVPAVWQNSEASSPIGYRRITLSVTVPKGQGAYKVRMVISDPVMAVLPAGCCTDTSIPQVSYVDFFDATFSLPSSSTLANRKDILAYAKNFLSQSVVTSAVTNLEPVSS